MEVVEEVTEVVLHFVEANDRKGVVRIRLCGNIAYMDLLQGRRVFIYLISSLKGILGKYNIKYIEAVTTEQVYNMLAHGIEDIITIISTTKINGKVAYRIRIEI